MVAGAHDETDGYFWIYSPADTSIAIAPLLLLEGWEELSKKEEKKLREAMERIEGELSGIIDI